VRQRGVHRAEFEAHLKKASVQPLAGSKAVAKSARKHHVQVVV
jgi:hypothetical protein